MFVNVVGVIVIGNNGIKGVMVSVINVIVFGG